jgi:hypothetical protein
MLKKKIIFGSVVLLLAALFALTGCSQATDSDGTSTVYSENHLFGTADYTDVARAVASAKNTGRSVVLTDQLTIVATAGLPSVADFGDVPVRVEGEVTVGVSASTQPVIVNAARSTLSFEPDAKITVIGAGVFIYKGDGEHIYTAADNSGYKVKYVENPLEGAQGTDARIAVPNFQIPAADAAGRFSNVAAHITHLYVLDKVTVNAASENPGPTTGTLTPGRPGIIALGEVDLTESNSTAFIGAGNNFLFTREAFLTSAPGNVTLGLPNDAVLPTVKALTPIAIAPPAVTSSLTITRIEGPETVSINIGTSIATLTFLNVAASGRVDVRVPQINSLVTIGDVPSGGTNAGSVSLTTTGTGMGAVTIFGNHTGSTSISTANLVGALNLAAATGKNAGTITVNAPTISGAVGVDINAGTINLTAATVLSGNVTVADNSGDINIATPSVTPAVIAVATNTGEINFIQELNSTLAANFLKVPNNKNIINFSLITATAAFGGTGADSIGGTGKVVFGGPTTFGGATRFDCDTEFTSGVTFANATKPYLNGNVTLAYEQAITLGTATDGITLGAGKRVLVGPNPVLAAGNDPVTLAIAATGVLRAGTELPDDTLGEDPETFVGNKTLTLTGVPITAITGGLRVPGVLRLGITGNIVGTGSLTLEDGGILAINGNTTALTATIGDTVITGPATANTETRLIASGGPVTLAANRISGNGATLGVVPDLGSPTITLSGSTKTLTIAGVNLDLYGSGSGAGSLVIAASGGAAGTENKVILANLPSPGRITLGDTTTNSITGLNGKVLEAGTYDGALSGNGIVRGDSETLPTIVGDLSAAPAQSLTITGLLTATNNITIVGDGTIQVRAGP